MAEIIPAVIGRTFAEIRTKIEQVEGLVNWVQVDVADGIFAKPASWGNPDDLRRIGGKTKIEVHLMVEYPEETLVEWFAAADRVLVHYEATDKLEQIIGGLENREVNFGLVLNLGTPIASIEPYLSRVKLVQFMSIAEIGHHGEPFDERVLPKIRELRVLAPGVKISVDGGINLKTAKLCLAAGADHLIVGSALWESKDISKTIKAFQNLKS